MAIQVVSAEQFESMMICPTAEDMVDEFVANGLKPDNTIIYLDGDIPIFKCAAVTDNKQYIFRGRVFRYKKDALEAAKANGFGNQDIETRYKPHSPDVAKAVFNTAMKNLQSTVEGYPICTVVSNGGSFRKEIYPSYKNARKDKRTPANRKPLLKHALDTYDAIYQHKFEADDLMATYCCNTDGYGRNAVIATIDKDLDTVPGWHWNFDKNLLYYINDLEAFRFFCAQVMMGDTTDSIPGLLRVGKVGAMKLVKDCETMAEMWDIVCNKYKVTKPGDKEFNGSWKEYLYVMSEMIYIRRNLDQPYYKFLQEEGIDPQLPEGVV